MWVPAGYQSGLHSSGEVPVSSATGTVLDTRRGNSSHRIVVGIAYADGAALVSGFFCWLPSLELILVREILVNVTRNLEPGNKLDCSRYINFVKQAYYMIFTEKPAGKTVL